jgi:hypothetical protein
MYHYEFDNLKNHAMVSIYKGNEFIDYYLIHDCQADFKEADLLALRFLDRKSVNRFAMKYNNKQVSSTVLIKLGLTPEQVAQDIRQ